MRHPPDCRPLPIGDCTAATRKASPIGWWHRPVDHLLQSRVSPHNAPRCRSIRIYTAHTHNRGRHEMAIGQCTEPWSPQPPTFHQTLRIDSVPLAAPSQIDCAHRHRHTCMHNSFPLPYSPNIVPREGSPAAACGGLANAPKIASSLSSDCCVEQTLLWVPYAHQQAKLTSN